MFPNTFLPKPLFPFAAAGLPGNCSGGDISPIRKFRVQAEGGTSCRISFRIPRWAKGVNRILVNGEDMGLSAQPDTWAVLEREWQADDVIEISFLFPWNSGLWMKKTRILRRCASVRWFWRRIRCPCLTGHGAPGGMDHMH